MLRQQRRGKGSNAYSKKPYTFCTTVSYPNRNDELVGEVTRFLNDPGRTTPIMEMLYEDLSVSYLLAPEGIRVGDKVHVAGSKMVYSLGSVVRIGDIPEGTPVYNIESKPGDGGKFARGAGAAGYIASHIGSNTSLMLPSRNSITLPNNCKAQLGILAGGGRTDKPRMKAGKNYWMQKPLNRRWPTNRGVKMNPVDHPFGGKQHHKGKSSMTSRNAPPGRKVGHIAASRVGRRKR